MSIVPSSFDGFVQEQGLMISKPSKKAKALRNDCLRGFGSCFASFPIASESVAESLSFAVSLASSSLTSVVAPSGSSCTVFPIFSDFSAILSVFT